MKKFKIMFSVFVIFVLMVGLFGCDEEGLNGNEYTITFNANGGSQVLSIEAKEGSSIPKPASPRKDGYRFEGWFFDTELEEEVVWPYTLDGDITFYAYWKPISDEDLYKVTWKNDDGTILKVDNDITAGTAPTYDGDTPTKEATKQYTYTFSGWTPEISEVQSDQVYTATYTSTLNKYKVTFLDWDGSSLDEQMIEYGKDALAPTPPIRDGYIFIGWSDEFSKIEEDKEIEALYEEDIDISLFKYLIKDGEVKITDYTGTSTKVIVPSKIEDLPVTTIGAYAFAWLDNLKEIIIPKSITTIEGQAFHASKLESITLPFIGQSRTATDELAHFGYIFNDTYSYDGSYLANNYHLPSSLKEVIITDAIKIGENAFHSTRITHLEISNTLIYIEDYAFYTARYLKSIKFEENSNLESIGRAAFYGVSLLPSITIPRSVVNIKREAFRNCSNLESVIFEDNSSLKVLENAVFNDTINLVNIDLPNSLTHIGNSSFGGSTGLISITIPNSVFEIGQSAFIDCSNLESVIFEDNSRLESIGNYAFSKTNLLSITIPNSLISIGDYAFEQTSNLEELLFEDDSKLEKIGKRAFNYARSLKGITLPNSLIKVDDFAFHNDGNSSLTNIVIPKTITTIGESAFYGAKVLKSITIPNSIINIEKSAFSGTNSLEEIIFEENSKLKNIGDLAFWGAWSLKKIIIPKSVTAIGYRAFYNHNYSNSVLREIIFEDNSILQSIGDEAFSGTHQVRSIIIPITVTAIGKSAFAGPGHLTIYANQTAKPTSWSSSWISSNHDVYWAGEWNYDENHNPVPN